MTSPAPQEPRAIGEQLTKMIEQNVKIIDLLEGIRNQNDAFYQRYMEQANYPRSVKAPSRKT